LLLLLLLFILKYKTMKVSMNTVRKRRLTFETIDYELHDVCLSIFESMRLQAAAYGLDKIICCLANVDPSSAARVKSCNDSCSCPKQLSYNICHYNSDREREKMYSFSYLRIDEVYRVESMQENMFFGNLSKLMLDE
jgi:hypothetical protein